MAEPALPLVAARLTFRAESGLRLPLHPGFAWRGAFGHALKRTVCAMRMRPCAGCMLSGSCLYPYMFATEPPETAARMSRYRQVPRPFAIRADPAPADLIPEGGEVAVTVSMFGNACQHLAYVLRAFEIAGEQGFGARRTALTLLRAERAEPPAGASSVIYVPGGDFQRQRPAAPAPPPCPQRVEIELLSPLRLKQDGHLVTPERFAPRHLLASLVRRVSMLMYFHTDAPLEADFRGLKEAMARIPAEHAALHWLDLTRSSARQHTTMQMGGLLGAVTLGMRDAGPLWPYLWLGQFIQAGKGTTMGLGAYRIMSGQNASELEPAG